jgi:hypothetical protein
MPSGRIYCANCRECAIQNAKDTKANEEKTEVCHCGHSHSPKLSCLVARLETKMKSQRKYQWDDASFLMRTDPEREPKPRIESEPLTIRINKQFGIPDLERAWGAIGVKFDVVRFMDHLEALGRWERRRLDAYQEVRSSWQRWGATKSGK